jgi:choline dehydrogenase-like flavoprotein
MNLNVKAKGQNTYDAIVVGSGISGGYAAMELTKKGLSVLLLERGREVKHVTDYPTALKHPWELEHRGRLPLEDREKYRLTQRNYSVNEANQHFYVNELENPYVQTLNETFVWPRGHQVGGRSLIWGRQCYRWSDLDFEANLRDGAGVDWPLRYKDLEPWYRQVEKFVGISGSPEGLPHLPDGEFLAPMEMNCLEKHVSLELRKRYSDRRMIIGRVANLTQPIEGRGLCVFRNQCDRGCPNGGYFSSNSATLPVALKTGLLTLRPQSIVLNVVYDEQAGKAKGVTVLDAETGQTYEYYSRIIFLNASTISTAMIMLNSMSGRFPNGLGNDSGELGHNLMTHHKTVVTGRYEGFTDQYYTGRRANGIYIPRFQNVTDQNPDFVRGYNYQGGASRPQNQSYSGTPAFGAGFKESLTRPADHWDMGLVSFGEQLPDHSNFVQPSKKVQDKWKLPVPEITFSWKDNEYRMSKHAIQQAQEMLEQTGFKNVRTTVGDPEPMSTVHEMGTARMGKDPKTSVLNAHNQVHAVPNVFVTDGACMTSCSSVNPSLTYMALTARACDYAVKYLKQQAV